MFSLSLMFATIPKACSFEAATRHIAKMHCIFIRCDSHVIRLKARHNGHWNESNGVLPKETEDWPNC